MSGETTGRVQSVTARALSAEFSTTDADTFAVAPAAGDELNRLRFRPIPRACFKVEDAIFAFDSSFIAFGRSPDVDKLKELLDRHPGSKLSIFGHADPVGRDDYNKVLSGRRARAVFGMLLQDPAEWRPLYYEHDANGKDRWGLRSVQIMLNVSGITQGDPADGTTSIRIDGKLDEPTRAKLRTFQGRNALPPTPFGPAPEHAIDPATFDALAAAYMKVLCLVDAEGNTLRLARTDFLARGQRPDGKGDYQGCSEFNPALVFSRTRQAQLDRPERREERNAANQPNRRVMILLFRAGASVDPAQWPCPAASEGPAACRKRFFRSIAGLPFPDGETRRAPGAVDREFEKTNDTFACRFYQSLVTASPCERVTKAFRIRLYDLAGVAIPFAPCEVVAGGRPPVGDQADAAGIVLVRDVDIPSPCTVRWGHPAEDGAAPDLDFELRVVLGIEESEDVPTEMKQRLHNLGYPEERALDENVRQFQEDCGSLVKPPLQVTGELDERTVELIRDIHAHCAADVRRTPPPPRKGAGG